MISFVPWNACESSAAVLHVDPDYVLAVEERLDCEAPYAVLHMHGGLRLDVKDSGRTAARLVREWKECK